MPVATNRKSNDHAIAAIEALRLVVLCQKTAPGLIRAGKRVFIDINNSTFSWTTDLQVSRLGQLKEYCGRMRPALETGCRMKSWDGMSRVGF